MDQSHKKTYHQLLSGNTGIRQWNSKILLGYAGRSGLPCCRSPEIGIQVSPVSRCIECSGLVASRVTGGFADLWVDCWLQVGHCWLEIGASRSQEAALGRPAKVSHCSSSSIWIWICCRNLLISASKVQETALHWEATTPLSNFKLLHVFVDLCQHCISHWASGNWRVIGGH